MNAQTFSIGPVIGMSKAERERYSVPDYADALLRQDGPRISWYDSISDVVAKLTGQQRGHGGSMFVPGDMAGTVTRRDLTAGVATAGGFTVDTGIGGFAAPLYQRSLLGVLPVTRLQSLRSNITLGTESARGSAGWVTENGSLPDAQAIYGQIALAPKLVGGKFVYSHQYGLQLGAAGNAFILANLARLVGDAFDTALLHGNGATGQPTGIANTVGIDSRAGTSLTWADALAMLKLCEGYSQGDSIIAVAGVNAAEVARKRERATGSGFIAEGDRFAGKPMIVSRAASAATLTLMDWTGCWIGDWGALELQIDPFSFFTSGRVQVSALWLVDMALERPSKVAYASAVS